MAVSPASPLSVLSYAPPTIRTSPRRTGLRVVLSAIGSTFVTIVLGIRLGIVGLGYLVLAAGIVVTLVAKALLFLGGLRWKVLMRRSLDAAQWVDSRVLGIIAIFRRPFAREA